MNAVEKKCRELGCSIERLFNDAAAWAKVALQRTINQGALMAAVKKFLRTHTIPDWVGKYLSFLDLQTA